MTATLNSEQHIVLNRWASSGPAAFCSKLGKKWQVAVNGESTPMLFPTKRAAMAHADARVKAFLEPR